MTLESLCQRIDHTVLSPETTPSQVVKLCQEAKDYGFFSVCINSYYVKLAEETLKGSLVKVCTVIGFPLGLHTTKVKCLEAEEAIEYGVDELDMPMNMGEFKERNYKKVEEDIKAIVNLNGDKVVKVIIGTNALNEQEIQEACRLCMNSGAHFVKTSTGFFRPGAQLKDIKVIKEALDDKTKIKASGGIRTLEQAQSFLEAGAHRIGTSSGVHIVKEFQHAL